MRVRTRTIVLIAITAATIAISILCDQDNADQNDPTVASRCEAPEVFRWSDRSCYVPQGE